MTGYDQPAIHTPGRSFTLGNRPDPRIGSSLYGNLTTGFLEQNMPAEKIEIGGTPRRLHQIKTRLPAGEVVMLLTRYWRQYTYTADYAPVGKGGIVRIKSLEPRLSFTSKVSDLGITKNGVPRALLVRVTNIPLNNLKAGIFVPAKTTSDAN